MKDKNNLVINKKQGQILIMSLFILLVLSIITLSTIVILSVDTRKKLFNESYDTNYFYSETRIIQTAELLAENYEVITFDALDPGIGIPTHVEGYWLFNDGGTTTAIDRTGNGNDASLNNMTNANWTDGEIGGAIEFDGVNDYLSLPNSTSASVSGSNFTIGSWIYVDEFPDAGQSYVIFDKDQQYSFAIDSSGQFAWTDSSNWGYANFGYTNIGIQERTWQHVTITKNGSSIKLYLNGSPVVTRNYGGAVTENSSRTFFGCNAGASSCVSGAYFDGRLDSFVISSQTFSDQEVLDLYNFGFEQVTAPPTSTPIASLNQGSNNPPSVAGASTSDLYNKLVSLYSRAIGDNNISDPDCTPGFDSMDCTIEEEGITTEISLELKNDIDDLEMTGTDVLQLDIYNDELGVSYTGPIRWTWTNSPNVLWSISMIYTRQYVNDLTGATEQQYEIVKDTYDCRNLGTSPCSTNKFSSSGYVSSSGSSLPGNEAIQISMDPTTIVDEIIGTNGANHIDSVYLRLRPIILDDTAINISLEGNADLPIQFAEIQSQSFERGIGASTPSPYLSMRLPLVPAPPSLYDYVYYQSR